MTYEELRAKRLQEVANKCDHKWTPLSFSLENQGHPDLNEGKVFCYCPKCMGHTYFQTSWIGYFLGGTYEVTNEGAVIQIIDNSL